jgi:hypothetical protein
MMQGKHIENIKRLDRLKKRWCDFVDFVTVKK